MPRMSPRTLQLRTRTLDLSTPVVMGVLNVTPDSFSDGGRFLAPAEAVAHARAMARAGAAIIDIGGESTRPGALPVAAGEELARVLPVL
ncbi:MAG: dihydropteroate synthase, partial [Gammaproteobacteria bacterium]